MKVILFVTAVMLAACGQTPQKRPEPLSPTQIMELKCKEVGGVFWHILGPNECNFVGYLCAKGNGELYNPFDNTPIEKDSCMGKLFSKKP